MPSITLPTWLANLQPPAWYAPWMLWLSLFLAIEAGLLALVVARAWPAWVLAVPPLAVLALVLFVVITALSDPNTFR